MRTTVSPKSATIHFDSQQEMAQLALQIIQQANRATPDQFPGTSLQFVDNGKPWITLKTRHAGKTVGEFQKEIAIEPTSTLGIWRIVGVPPEGTRRKRGEFIDNHALLGLQTRGWKPVVHFTRWEHAETMCPAQTRQDG